MYEITIQKLTPKEGKDYPDRQEVYKQIVEHLELDKVIMFINEQKPDVTEQPTGPVPPTNFGDPVTKGA